MPAKASSIVTADIENLATTVAAALFPPGSYLDKTFVGAEIVVGEKFSTTYRVAMTWTVYGEGTVIAPELFVGGKNIGRVWVPATAGASGTISGLVLPGESWAFNTSTNIEKVNRSARPC